MFFIWQILWSIRSSTALEWQYSRMLWRNCREDADDILFASNPFRLLTEAQVVLSLGKLNIQDLIHLNWNPRMTSQHMCEISEIRPSIIKQYSVTVSKQKNTANIDRVDGIIKGKSKRIVRTLIQYYKWKYVRVIAVTQFWLMDSVVCFENVSTVFHDHCLCHSSININRIFHKSIFWR